MFESQFNPWSIVFDAHVILRPVESIQANMCLVHVLAKRMNDEIVLSSTTVQVWPANFCIAV